MNILPPQALYAFLVDYKLNKSKQGIVAIQPAHADGWVPCWSSDTRLAQTIVLNQPTNVACQRWLKLSSVRDACLETPLEQKMFLAVVLGRVQQAIEDTLRGDHLMKTWQAKDSVMKGALTPQQLSILPSNSCFGNICGRQGTSRVHRWVSQMGMDVEIHSRPYVPVHCSAMIRWDQRDYSYFTVMNAMVVWMRTGNSGKTSHKRAIGFYSVHSQRPGCPLERQHFLNMT